jgi:(1->4)-alpha-D-glucan 1-alpha-D-glucosylmutase
VYRTYIRNLDLPAEAPKLLEEALAQARLRKPGLNPQCFDFLQDVLLLSNAPHVLPDHREARLNFVLRWQQFTGPIVAKGLEDTALYVYQPLLSLNEVGGDPTPGSVCAKEFFEFIAHRQGKWPHSMNASSTHDTKRSEDVRARIAVLSEMPQEWEARLKQWAVMNERHKSRANGAPVPDRNEEYFLYQTILGVWPLQEDKAPEVVKRLQAYAVKATREAMVHTRWTRPNLAHEEGLTNFVAGILDESRNGAFLEDLRRFHRDTSFYGMLNSISQTLLKITAPGVPDFYQGSELWDFRLVDPDNRGVVDFAKRMELLKALGKNGAQDTGLFAGELLSNWTDGRIKLYLIWKTLGFRRKFSELFTDGEFVPAEISGERAENVTAFFRIRGDRSALIVAPKWLAASGIDREAGEQTKFWGNTFIALPENAAETWRNVLTNESVVAQKIGERAMVRVADALRQFPVALLSSE